MSFAWIFALLFSCRVPEKCELLHTALDVAGSRKADFRFILGGKSREHPSPGSISDSWLLSEPEGGWVLAAHKASWLSSNRGIIGDILLSTLIKHQFIIFMGKK